MDSIKKYLNALILDGIALLGSWYLFYYIRFEANLIEGGTSHGPADLLIPSIVITAYWLCIFTIFGLYKKSYLISRFDEVLRVGKVTILGTLILFFVLFMDTLGWTSENIQSAKNVTFTYWSIVFACAALMRLMVRTFEISQVKKGRGLHRALIVGTGETAMDIQKNLMRHKTSGMNVIGYIAEVDSAKIGSQLEDVPILGNIRDLKKIITEYDVKDVIVALEQEDSEALIQVVDEIDIPDISVKIVPGFIHLISGLNQTNQIFGIPLIEVMPDPMPSWEKFVKRLFDLVISALILLVTFPIFLILVALIKLTSDGPAIFKQERVGLYGKIFTIYKFRTMYQNAEERSGPVWASENDPRITPLGHWLRKLRLDEIPQLYNVIRGDMSLVGPRPERQYFVEQFKKEIPLYTRRLRVRPGITGWAQVKWKYDESLEDVKEKTKYDLFYVENMSLRMDFKILFNTIFTVIAGKGQ